MQYVITAVGPDHRGLADPIVHCVTQLGGNIAEIQMYLQRGKITFQQYGNWYIFSIESANVFHSF